MKLVFFHTPKPKQFSYSPRYFDVEKDRREQRRKELGLGGDSAEGDFRSRMDASWRRFRKSESRVRKKTNLSLLIYLFIVVLLIYYIFFK